MASFGFADGQHLVFSIEIRKEKAESYSALAGFFRAYEPSFIARGRSRRRGRADQRSG
jgi:hypothetical protein